MSNDPQHDAKMAAMRRRGFDRSNRQGRVDVPGGMAGLPERIAHDEPTGRPWNRVEFWDDEWKGDDEQLAWLLAHELLPEYDVDDVDLDVVAASATVTTYLEGLTERLGRQLEPLVQSGLMTRRQQRRELERFETGTADEVAFRMAPHLLPLLRDRADRFHEDE